MMIVVAVALIHPEKFSNVNGVMKIITDPFFSYYLFIADGLHRTSIVQVHEARQNYGRHAGRTKKSTKTNAAI